MPFDLSLGDPLVRAAALTLLILVAALIIARLARRLIGRYVDAPERQYRATRYFRRILALVALVLILVVWSPGMGGLVTVLTVIGAGFAIALRELLLSLAGWVRLHVRGLYAPGDRIEVDGVRGDVLDVRLLHTTLMEIGAWVEADQSSGRLTYLPNSFVFQHPVHNYTSGFQFVWNELPVTVTFQSDWQAARQIMQEQAEQSSEEIARRAAGQLRRLAPEYPVHFDVLTPFVYARITERGVLLTLRHLCEARQRRGAAHALTTALLERFRAHDAIDLAPGVRASVYEGSAFGNASPPDAGDASPENPSSPI